MIFNVSGGGGAALNFKVLAYATEEELAAATPAENTIGIITTTPITSWIFSATEPTGVAGMVRIHTDVDSPVEFNALKKNGIQVYPIFAKQYVSGAWVDVTAKSYQGGEWVDWWNGELFIDGDQYTSVTGGWVQAGYIYLSGDSSNNGSISIGTSLYVSGTGGANCKSFRTANKIDLTAYSKLTWTGSANGGNCVVVSSTTDGYSFVANTDGSNKQLDISALSGSYYIGGFARNGGSLTINTMQLVR